MHRIAGSSVERVMRHATIKLLGVLVSTSLVSSPAFAAETSPAKKPAQAPAKADSAKVKGFVNVVCNPSCDDVVAGGRSLGPSPIVRAELPAGTHKLILKRKSQADKEVEVEVKAGEVAVLNVKLPVQKAPSAAPPPEVAEKIAARALRVDGWLNLVCKPGCDEVIIDGTRKLGRGPHENVALRPGLHELTLKLKGAPDKVMTVSIVGGQTVDVEASMPVEVKPAAASKPEPKALPKR
jgi:hypothetical protein